MICTCIPLFKKAHCGGYSVESKKNQCFMMWRLCLSACLSVLFVSFFDLVAVPTPLESFFSNLMWENFH